MGSTREDSVFDPALDINQDGVISLMDKLSFTKMRNSLKLVNHFTSWQSFHRSL